MLYDISSWLSILAFVQHVSNFQWHTRFSLQHVRRDLGTTNNSPSSLSTGNSSGLRRHLSGLHSVLHPSTLLLLSLSLYSTPHPARALLTKTTNPSNASYECVPVHVFVCTCMKCWSCCTLHTTSHLNQLCFRVSPVLLFANCITFFKNKKQHLE